MRSVVLTKVIQSKKFNKIYRCTCII